LAGYEAGAVYPAKKIKLEPHQDISAQASLLAENKGPELAVNGANPGYSPIAGAESQPVVEAAPVDPLLKSILDAALHAETAFSDTESWPANKGSETDAQDPSC
jgi:hypothetical protein